MKRIVINEAPHETRILITEDGKLCDLLVERPENSRIAGNIYKGTVNKVLPGLQAAFIEIGMEKAAFLHLSDINKHQDLDLILDEDEDGPPPAPRGRVNSIKDAVKENQEIAVQVIKEPISTKGPKVTTDISFPGRFLVMIPGSNFIGVSRKIKNYSKRKELKKIVKKLKPENTGFIVRTMAKEIDKEDFEAEIKSLIEKWKKLRKEDARKKAPALLYREAGVLTGAIRDLFNEEIEELIIDSREGYNEIKTYIKELSPHLLDRIKLYREKMPIFEKFSMEKEIAKLLHRKVWLKNGGSLIFDYTEALVAIDVNSGRNVRRKNQRHTTLETNLNAAREIATQLRLRDIGGIIVIDFIDMDRESDKDKVYNELKNAIRGDRCATNISSISEFGLIEMTRKRVRPNILFSFSEVCENCGGVGRVLSRETLITMIERSLKKIRNIHGIKRAILYTHPSVENYLTDEDRGLIREIQKTNKIKLRLFSSSRIKMDEYHIFTEDGIKEIEDI